VYRLVLPIHQKRKDYERQAGCYKDLHNLCRTIVQQNKTGERLFSNYYRVALYGQKFDSEDGSEFVYKEGAHIRLVEFVERLKVRKQGRKKKNSTLPLFFWVRSNMAIGLE
jgi:hypothetical protein